jgi:hypothetical protein
MPIARRSALIVTFFLTTWILLLQVQHVVQATANVGMWLGFSATLVLISGGWILFLSLNRSSRERRLKYLTEPRVRRFLFGAACVVLGLSDLVYLRSTAGTAPAWLAAQVFVFYLFGWGHFAAGLALLFEVVPRLAATLEGRMITSFVLLIYIPGVCAAPGNRLQSTIFFMASGLAGASWVVAGSLRAFS